MKNLPENTADTPLPIENPSSPPLSFVRRIVIIVGIVWMSALVVLLVAGHGDFTADFRRIFAGDFSQRFERRGERKNQTLD